ncbi:hypothetical protein [Leifsonia sp. SIMBA_070]|uniref:hypothetical protein n=1 Tax=Leifsonia sp. SIMBA_070 TaxID=3085810 RepID=UPI003979019F
MAEADERDLVEGRYTQAEPETAEPRDVHGQYTESDGHPGPEADIVGAYVGSEREGSEPLVRSSHLRSGNYPKADHETHENDTHTRGEGEHRE